MLKKGLSIVVPAYNEAGNIKGVIKKIHSIVPKYCKQYEIIIINDGSLDNTGQIINSLAKKDSKIKPLHNHKNQGMGYSYFKALDKVAFNYSIIIFGDDDHPPQSISNILAKMGQADIVVPFYTNLHLSKTWMRHVISITYTHIVNHLTGLKIGYYNGITLHRSNLIKQTPIKTSGFGFQAETIVYLIKNGRSFLEVDVLNSDRQRGGSSAFKIKNILSVVRSFFRLYINYKLNRYQKNFKIPSEV